jgi:hypothetical protein
MSITKIPKFGKAVATYIKNKFDKKDPTISSVKTKVNKTKLDKADSNLNIAKQKLKAGKAKLDQTVFEIKNKMPITFKSNKGKSESNTESYKRITGENNKVIKGMLDKAAGKK